MTVGNLYSLDDKFVASNAFAIGCHLPNITEHVGSPWFAAAKQEMRKLTEIYGPDVSIIKRGDINIFTDENGNLDLSIN